MMKYWKMVKYVMWRMYYEETIIKSKYEWKKKKKKYERIWKIMTKCNDNVNECGTRLIINYILTIIVIWCDIACEENEEYDILMRRLLCIHDIWRKW